MPQLSIIAAQNIFISDSFCIKLYFYVHTVTIKLRSQIIPQRYSWMINKLQIVVLSEAATCDCCEVWRGGSDDTNPHAQETRACWRNKVVAALPETLPSLLKAGACMTTYTCSNTHVADRYSAGKQLWDCAACPHFSSAHSYKHHFGFRPPLPNSKMSHLCSWCLPFLPGLILIFD